jgi:ferritin-like protein
MNEQPNMGVNRTGIQMSPIDTSAMAKDEQQLMPAVPDGVGAINTLRSSYITKAEPIGSVPVPGTIKGAFTTGVSMLTGNSPQLLLDKLGERMAFERTGTRLYDALITKVMAQQELGVATLPVDRLMAIREEEASHMALVADAIAGLGGDPTSMTPCADIAGVEAMGLVQVLNDPRSSVMQSLHAILVVELTDNDGWDMLILLANAQNHHELGTRFTAAREREREHLQLVQGWFQQAVLSGAAGGAETAAAGASH